MQIQDLFNELVANIEFNGDIELFNDDTLVWTLKYEPIELEEGEETEDVLETLIESFEEDLDFIYDLLDEFEFDFEYFEEADEFEFDGETLKIELYAYENSLEEEEEIEE